MPAAASRRKQKSHCGHALELDPVMSKAHLALVNLYMFQQRSEDAASELRAFRGWKPTARSAVGPGQIQTGGGKC
jgi:hypothetical protein